MNCFLKKAKGTATRDHKSLDSKGRGKAVLFLFAAFFIAFALLDAHRCGSDFIVKKYAIGTPKASAPIRIAMLSDLHESEFGVGNERLIEAVNEAKPDIILCPGDIITRTVSDDELHIGLDLMRALVQYAPVYMSLGNHERDYIREHGSAILDSYESTGVHILDCAYENIHVSDQALRIGGISESCFSSSDSDKTTLTERKAFLSELSGTDALTILLCHRPTDFISQNAEDYSDLNIDLVLSGHTHGGLWQIPFIGAVFLPQEGFFPSYAKGLKSVGGSRMIIGAGLGSERLLFRINNPCELVLIDIVPCG